MRARTRLRSIAIGDCNQPLAIRAAELTIRVIVIVIAKIAID